MNRKTNLIQLAGAFPRCMFVAEVEVAAGYRCPRHNHLCTEIGLTCETDGWICSGARRWQYGSWDVFVHQPGCEHWAENNHPDRHICVGVSGAMASRLLDGVCTPLNSIRASFERILAVSRSNSPIRQDRLDLLAGLLVLDLLDLAPQPAHEADDPNPVHTAKRVLDQRFAEPLSIRDLADSLYISPEHLRKVFRETFGASPLHYLIRRRIEHAQELLRMTDVPVQEVAQRCGIDNPYYFSRLFHQVTSLTPTAYRRRHHPGHRSQ